MSIALFALLIVAILVAALLWMADALDEPDLGDE